MQKRKNLLGCFRKPTTYWKWTPPGNFHKISPENHYDCRQIGSKQIPASMAVVKQCISHEIVQCGTELLWKSTSKWDYIKKRQPNDSDFQNIENLSTWITIFCLSKRHQGKHVEIATIIHSLKLYGKCTLKSRQLFVHWSYIKMYVEIT